MRGRRRARSGLPYAPLLMLHPMDLPGADVPGRAIVDEVRTTEGAALYSVHRQLLRWTRERGGSAGRAEWWSELERAMLLLPDEALGKPLGLLAGCFCRPGEPDGANVAMSCLAISDWALGRDCRGTAADFARLAALACAGNPRFACVAGGMLLAAGQPWEAEWWYARAHRVAVWTRDRETAVRALIGSAAAAARRAGPTEAAPAYRHAISVAAALRLDGLLDEALLELSLSLYRRD